MGRRRLSTYRLPDYGIHTNWSSPKTNIFSAIWSLKQALSCSDHWFLIREWNENCEYPIRVNPNLPYSEQVSKRFKHKVWVVARYGKDHKLYSDKQHIPFYIKLLNVIVYPLKFIPIRSVLKMKEYTIYTYRIGGVTNGYSVEFHIPKKFSFK